MDYAHNLPNKQNLKEMTLDIDRIDKKNSNIVYTKTNKKRIRNDFLEGDNKAQNEEKCIWEKRMIMKWKAIRLIF